MEGRINGWMDGRMGWWMGPSSSKQHCGRVSPLWPVVFFVQASPRLDGASGPERPPPPRVRPHDGNEPRRKTAANIVALGPPIPPAIKRPPPTSCQTLALAAEHGMLRPQLPRTPSRAVAWYCAVRKCPQCHCRLALHATRSDAGHSGQPQARNSSSTTHLCNPRCRHCPLPAARRQSALHAAGRGGAADGQQRLLADVKKRCVEKQSMPDLQSAVLLLRTLRSMYCTASLAASGARAMR